MTIASRISASPLAACPFRHVVVDDCLSPEELAAIHAHWPGPDRFHDGGIRGNFVFDLARGGELGDPDREFWAGFWEDIAAQITDALAERYLDVMTAKFGKTVPLAPTIILQEMGPTFAGHEVHNHHWHSPNWVFTSILYVDHFDDAPGTTLYGLNGNSDLRRMAEIAALTLQWEDMEDIIPVATIPCRPNRLLSFIDSPISYHGVEPPRSAIAARGRRMIRMHVSAPGETIQEIYGVLQAQYQVHRRRASRKPFVIDWLQKEIAQLQACGAVPGV